MLAAGEREVERDLRGEMMTSPLVRVALQHRAFSRSSGFTCTQTWGELENPEHGRKPRTGEGCHTLKERL